MIDNRGLVGRDQVLFLVKKVYCGGRYSYILLAKNNRIFLVIFLMYLRT